MATPLPLETTVVPARTGPLPPARETAAAIREMLIRFMAASLP
jgi:hypothetical protein